MSLSKGGTLQIEIFEKEAQNGFIRTNKNKAKTHLL